MSSIAESEPESLRSPLVGARIHNRYRVQHVHRRGGTSVIYAAIDEQQRREVALKVLDGAIAPNAGDVARFEAEARVARSLAHANLVALLDYGRLIDGRLFLVMPMIAGTDMATLLAQQGPQHPRRVAALLEGAASALDLLHARGCVHGDIKSENLMQIVDAAGRETTLVLDFGLASLRGWKPSSYVAPEVFLGDAVDHRGDIHSLATVAFELMTGRLPCPQALEKVFERALARCPDERQSTASELIRQLALAAEGNAKPRATTARSVVNATALHAPHMRPSPVPEAPAKPAKPMSRAAALRARSIELRMAALKVIQEHARDVPLPPESPREDAPAQTPGESAPEAASSNPDISFTRLALHTMDDDEPGPPARRRVFVFAPAVLVVLAAIAVLIQGQARPAPSAVRTQAAVAAALQAAEPEPAPVVEPVAERAAAALVPVPELALAAAARTSSQRSAAPEPRASRAKSASASDNSNPSQAKMLTDQASDGMIGGAFSAAVTAYQQAISADPRYAPAWRGKGLALERLGKTHDAAAAFRQFLQLEPNGASADKIRERLSALEP